MKMRRKKAPLTIKYYRRLIEAIRKYEEEIKND